MPLAQALEFIQKGIGMLPFCGPVAPTERTGIAVLRLEAESPCDPDAPPGKLEGAEVVPLPLPLLISMSPGDPGGPPGMKGIVVVFEPNEACGPDEPSGKVEVVVSELVPLPSCDPGRPPGKVRVVMLSLVPVRVADPGESTGELTVAVLLTVPGSSAVHRGPWRIPASRRLMASSRPTLSAVVGRLLATSEPLTSPDASVPLLDGKVPVGELIPLLDGKVPVGELIIGVALESKPKLFPPSRLLAFVS